MGSTRLYDYRQQERTEQIHPLNKPHQNHLPKCFYMFLPLEILVASTLWKEKDDVLTLLPQQVVFGRTVSLLLQQGSSNHPNFALVISLNQQRSHPTQQWEMSHTISPDRSCSQQHLHTMWTSPYSCQGAGGNHSISVSNHTALLPRTETSPSCKERGRGTRGFLTLWSCFVVALQENTV